MEILHKKRDTIPVQVVGLTASLGIGSGNDVLNVDRAMDHIMRMCVRMMATTLSTVRKEENILELKKHVSPPLDDVRTCARPKDDPYSAASMKVLKQIVEILKPDFEEAQFKGMEKIVRKYFYNGNSQVIIINFYFFRKTFRSNIFKIANGTLRLIS